ncbi:cytoplasmic phosphatidylinositol transfer protein 1-like protein [Pitangus sulphuratus]|nr:cytoplasmic phosphatidylinositol transfer protein 1-like protein [Pitangus sulphuratus]
MLMKEYRICMPLTVEEYRIGQLYMISKHSHEQSDRGEGVEVVQNEPFEDPNHGNGQLTEKRVYLNRQVQRNSLSSSLVQIKIGQGCPLQARAFLVEWKVFPGIPAASCWP